MLAVEKYRKVARAVRALSCSVLAIGGLLAGQAAMANESYPIKSITMVSPFSAGGGTDFIARLLGSELAQALGQTVVVENRPGANGMIGSDYVAKATADGYTYCWAQWVPTASIMPCTTTFRSMQ